MIGSVGYSSYQAVSDLRTSAAVPAAMTSTAALNGNDVGPASGTATSISPTARQLAGSAERAEQRDKTSSRDQLADTATRVMNELLGSTYYANKARNDAEVPNTDDPQLLARARQATDFVNRVAAGGTGAENPFSGLSREQLDYIVYDESGPYTVNERLAAYYEAYSQEQAWREKVCAAAMDEYHRSGQTPNFFQTVLSHFLELPPIEQAQYPKSYAFELQARINAGTTSGSGKREDVKEPSPTTFQAMINGQIEAIRHGIEERGER